MEHPSADEHRFPARAALDQEIAAAGPAVVPPAAAVSDPHRFAVESQPPALDYPFGSARLARVQPWPALGRLSMYSLRIATTGLREPHWHPEAAEPGDVHAVEARMTTIDPLIVERPNPLDERCRSGDREPTP